MAARINIKTSNAAFTLTGFPNTWIGPFDNLALLGCSGQACWWRLSRRLRVRAPRKLP